jgi:hypothetical protein
LDQWLNEWFRDSGSIGGTFGIWDILTVLSLSFLVALFFGWTYKHTHRGLSYSTSFVHTIVIMTVTVGIIMMVIGSNLARAFALVGALSIIRFRTAVKDPRDVAFIFMAMAAGMAMGTRFYVTGVVFALFACPMVWFLHHFDIGAMDSSEVLLKVHLPADLDPQAAFADVFRQFLREHTLLALESIREGTLLEAVYSVQLRPDSDEGALIERLRALNGGNRVVLLSGAQNVSV